MDTVEDYFRGIINEYKNNLSAYQTDPSKCAIYQKMLKSLEDEKKNEIEKARLQYEQTLRLAASHHDNTVKALERFYENKHEDLPREVLIRLHERYNILANRLSSSDTETITPPPVIPEAVVKVNIQKYDNFKMIDPHLEPSQAESYIKLIK